MASELEQFGSTGSDSVIDEKYLLRGLLGRGSMSSVFEAEQISTGRLVALKLLDSRYKANPTALERFRREAHVVTQLAHKNINEAYVFGATPEGQPYLVLELVKGTTLASELADGKKLPWPRIYKIADQLCDALQYAHSKGVVHRDLKPGNIMLTQSDTADDIVRVVDFGVSSLITDEQVQRLTQTGEVIGTPAYMSPEQCQSQPATERSDIYALGCIIYEMCCAQKPFTGATPYELMMKHISDEMPPWQPHDSAIPSPVKEVVYNAMAKNIKQRYQKASEVKSNLALASGNQAVSSHLRTASPDRIVKTHIGKVAVGSIILISLVGVLNSGNRFFSPKPPASPPSQEELIERQLPFDRRGDAIEDYTTLLGQEFLTTHDKATVARISEELAQAERYHTWSAQINLDTSFADQWRRVNFYRAHKNLSTALDMIGKLDAHGEADRNLRLHRVTWITNLFEIMTDDDVQQFQKIALDDIKHVSADEQHLDDLTRARIYLHLGSLYESYGERTGDLPAYKKALPEYKKSLEFWTRVYEANLIKPEQFKKIKNQIGESISKIEAQH
jgi:serine/threonine protein kinase